FTSEAELFAYLKATHPPQYPGHLGDEEYHDIALILFQMNDRPLDEIIAALPTVTTATSIPSQTSPSAPTQSAENTQTPALVMIAILGITFLVIVAIWILQKPRGR
ncbi:MAG TPA: hypothetical protein VLM78_01190, partial [Anaerolineales bacterium]|nr:hypothetical protein [Anaerolineales bacterium]